MREKRKIRNNGYSINFGILLTNKIILIVVPKNFIILLIRNN